MLRIVPWALAYHAGVSILAACAWALVVRFDWPDGLEEWASEAQGHEGFDEAGDADASR